jgi:hypothetical protein
MPLKDFNILKKDWLKGYKEVPKELPGSPINIESLNQPSRFLDRINIERQGVKNKRIMQSFDDVDLGNDLTLRNNPSRVKDKESILGKNKSLVTVKNKKTNEYIDLKSWLDPLDNKIKYYFSANMPSSKLKAGKAYMELEKHVPIGAEIKEPTSLSLDSFTNVVKQTKNPKFSSSVEGTIPLNDNAILNKLTNKGDSPLGETYYSSYKKAQSGADEINILLEKYNLPKSEVKPITTSSGREAAYEIHLPNISFKKLYTLLGITGTSAAALKQNKTNK